MSLFTATLVTGLALLAIGGHFLWRGVSSAALVKSFPRSTTAAYLTMGVASAWFLYMVLQLGPADFGQYRHLLFAVFLVTAVGSFFFVPDFLAVRGLAALMLLTSGELLDAAFLQPQQTRLFLVSAVYVLIALSLYLGASPFRMRDFLDWLYLNSKRPRALGGILAGYGALLLVVTLTY